jgi:ApaG protein
MEHCYYETTEGVEVKVEPKLVLDQTNSDLGYFFYKYNISIKNNSKLTHRIISRHWIVRDGRGHEEEVVGEGLLGEQPELEPGQVYEYSSACPLTTPTGNMRGAYYSLDQNGNEHKLTIPLFFLRPPEEFVKAERSEFL